MMQTISYVHMRTKIEKLDILNRPVAFSCVVVTADRGNVSGGKFIKIEHAVKYANLNRYNNLKPKKMLQVAANTPAKDPNHWVNQTTNLAIMAVDELNINRLVPTGELIKIHYRSIIFFNGKTVEC